MEYREGDGERVGERDVEFGRCENEDREIKKST
jgi:hypothetical protein